MEHFDYFVIGGGSGGVRSARIAASHGAKVGLAEKSALGGTCVNVGCVPKKLLSYAADYGPALEDMEGFGWEDVQANFNWSTLIRNKNTEISRLNDIYQNLLDSAGVRLFSGHARFIDHNILEINGVRVRADHILIATGGTPRRPHFPGAEYTIVSDDFFYLETFPERVVIEGGGYIGVEFAHILHGLGAHVTLLYRGNMWMRGFDYDVRSFLKEEYIKQGIDVRFETGIAYVTHENNEYQLFTDQGDQIDCDLVISAIGRLPNTENLGLENTEIETMPNHQIKINECWQTTQSHIYAIGDVSNQWNLTPYAIAQGHILADRLFGKGHVRETNFDLIPTAIFSSPPIGTVGLSEEEAKEQNINYKVFKAQFKPLRHTLSGRDEKTFMKLLVEEKTDKVVGCHMVGADTPEMLQGIAIAMTAGATKQDFDRTIGIHPTSAEELVTMK